MRTAAALRSTAQVGLLTALLGAPLLPACGGPAPAPAEVAAEAPAEPAAPAPPAAPVAEAPPPPAPGPLPPAEPTPEYPAVFLQGHGISLQLQPPFQVAQMPLAGIEQAAVVSWWDVHEPGAATSGRTGLHNLVLAPGPVTAGQPPFEPTTREDRRGTGHGLRLGPTGTELRIPAPYTALGGAGVLRHGPADPQWTIRVGDGPPLAWPDKALAHSGDPATGAPVYFDKMPKRPWGPWIE